MKLKTLLFLLLHFCFAIVPSAAPQNEHKTSLAILCFDNDTGDENLEYLSCGLSEWIISDLRQSKYVNVLDRNRMASQIERLDILDESKLTSEDFFEIAADSRIRHVVNGSYAEANGNLVISVDLWDSRLGQTIETTKAECANPEDIPPFVDKLTAELKTALGLTPDQVRDDLDREVGQITTFSPEAYRHYLGGLRHHHEGRAPEAILFYQKAIDVDADFALAYWRMGMALGQQSLTSYKKKSEALATAMNLTGRLSARDLYSVRGAYHSMSRYRYAGAMKAFGDLLELYPDDVEGQNGLGLLYFSIEEWDKAARQFRIAVEAGVEDPAAHLSLARAYINPGRYDEAQEVLEAYLGGIGDDVNIYLSLATVHRFRGEYDTAHQVLDRATAIYPNVAACYANKGDVYLYSGDLHKAETEYQKLLKNPMPEFNALGLYRLAELRLLQGRFESSLELAKQSFDNAQKRGSKGAMRDRLSFSANLDALTGHHREAIEKLDALWETTLEDEELEWQRWIVYRKGLVYTQTGQIERALREAEKLEGLIAKGLDKKKMRLFLHLMGVIELERKNYQKAVGYLEQSLPMVSVRSRLNIAVADFLASAYSGIGNRAKARKEYERMERFPRGRQFYGDVFALSFYRLANVCKAEGLKVEAMEYYERFLEIWKDADPAIPELELARRQLTDLKAR